MKNKTEKTSETRYSSTGRKERTRRKGRPRARSRKRINATMDRAEFEPIKQALAEQDFAHLSLSETVRMGLHLAAVVVPLFGRGGQLVFREADGSERAYRVPGQQDAEAAHLARVAPVSRLPAADEAAGGTEDERM